MNHSNKATPLGTTDVSPSVEIKNANDATLETRFAAVMERLCIAIDQFTVDAKSVGEDVTIDSREFLEHVSIANRSIGLKFNNAFLVVPDSVIRREKIPLGLNGKAIRLQDLLSKP